MGYKVLSKEGYVKPVPRAAVFKVPKGRFRSDTGSHTNISPSNMILGINEYFVICSCTHVLLHSFVKCGVDVRGQTTLPDVLSIKARVILSFSATEVRNGLNRPTL